MDLSNAEVQSLIRIYKRAKSGVCPRCNCSAFMNFSGQSSMLTCQIPGCEFTLDEPDLSEMERMLDEVLEAQRAKDLEVCGRWLESRGNAINGYLVTDSRAQLGPVKPYQL